MTATRTPPRPAPRPAARPSRPPVRSRRTDGRPLGRPGTRLRAGLGVVVVVLLVLSARIVQLQVVSDTGYAAKAVSQRRVSTPLPAERGTIVDRDGRPIAISVEGRAVTAQPRVIQAAECPPTATRPCRPDTIASVLAPVLGLPVEDVTAKLSRDTAFVYLARDLDIPTGNAVRDLKLLGVRVESEPRRTHPGGDLAANVVGFTNRDGQGAGGIELGMQSVLAGTDGRSVALYDKAGRIIPTGEQRVTEPVPGRSVQLTLDRDLQYYAQQVLAQKVGETEAVSGSAIVIDVKTGEVLALADAPTFNADQPGAAPADARGSAALGVMYDPGSVNKIITISAALETGTVTPDTVLTVPYSQQVGAKLVKDAESHGVEQLTVNGVFMKSSNVGTVQIAGRLGKEKLTQFLRAYGFGSKTGIGLPGEQAGIVPDPADWSGSSLGTIPIGQGVSVTALQVASVIQTVANDGVRITPTIVKATADADGTLQPAPAPEQHRVISAATAQAMHPMLEGVVSTEGTAPLAAIPGYRTAGKTGTADRAVDGHYDGSYTSSFVGFAPADAPRLATVVVLQGTGKKGYFGGSTAGPVFKQIMSFGLQSTGTPPTGVPFVAPRVYATDPK